MMPNQPKDHTKLILIAGILVSAVVVIVCLLVFGSHSKTPSNGVGSPSADHYDPTSGETVSNPSGKGPDTYGQNSNAPLFLGTSNLLNYGLTTDQVADVKLAFTNYSTSLKTPVKQVSIDVRSIKASPPGHEDPNAPSYVTFNVVLDNATTYAAKAQYNDLESIELFLTDPKTGRLIFDSGVISPGGGE